MSDFLEDPKVVQRMEVSRREMLRKSKDIIRVYNPLDKPFRYMWDGFHHAVPAKTTKEIERYLANHYFRKIAEYMIGQQILKEGDELLKMREQQFGKRFIDKFEENTEVWDRTPKLNDPDLLRAIRDTVILGLVEEYGYDMPEPESSVPVHFDTRSLHDQLFSEIDKRLAPELAPSVQEVTKE